MTVIKHTGTLNEVDEKGALFVYGFDCDGRYIEVTAFKPSKEGDLLLPNLKKGETYHFGEDVRSQGGREFHNLAKKWKGKTPTGYDYRLADVCMPEDGAPAAPQAAQPPARAPNSEPAAKPPFVSFVPKQDAREAYFAAKERSEPIQQAHMRRGGFYHDAAQIVAAMVSHGDLPSQRSDLENPAARAMGIVAEACEHMDRIVEHMEAGAQKAEEKWAMGSLKPAPKEEK